eukprot:5365550-Prymnesium_polylepis.1
MDLLCSSCRPFCRDSQHGRHAERRVGTVPGRARPYRTPPAEMRCAFFVVFCQKRQKIPK